MYHLETLKINHCSVQKQFIIALFLILLPCFVFSQSKKLSKKQFIADSIKIVRPRIARPQFRIDNRTIFSSKQLLNISGFDAGVVLKEKLRATLGYYSLSESNLTSLNKSIGSVLYKANYGLNYGALNLEFIYKNKRFFSLGMPVEFGLGQNTLKYKSAEDDTEIENKTGTILLAYFGLSGTFKPIRWIGLKVSIGYKKTVFNQLKDLHFDGIYTSVGLAIDFREIIRDIRMYSLKRKYPKNFNSVGTAVDLITD